MGYWSEQLRLRLGSGALSCSLSPPFLSISHLLLPVFLSVLPVSSPPPPTSSAPLSLSLLSFTPTKEKKVFACIRESKSLWGFPCPSLLSLLSCFPPLISPQMRNLPLLSWKRNILAISNLKDAQKLTNIQSHQAEIYSAYNVRLFTVLSAALWHPFTWDLLSISHTSDSVLCHN